MARKKKQAVPAGNSRKDEVTEVDYISDSKTLYYFDHLPKRIREFLRESVVVGTWSCRGIYNVYRAHGLELTLQYLKKIDQADVEKHNPADLLDLQLKPFGAARLHHASHEGAGAAR